MTEHRIGLTLAESTLPPVVRPYDPDAPNVLVIVLDDLGFAQLMGVISSDVDLSARPEWVDPGMRLTPTGSGCVPA